MNISTIPGLLAAQETFFAGLVAAVTTDDTPEAIAKAREQLGILPREIREARLREANG